MGWDLYVITDSEIGGGRSHEELARLAIAGGADIVQLRDKALSADELVRIGRKIAGIAKKNNRLFIVNDRPDIAIACGADGVHLGQDDLPVAIVRKIVPEGFIIGASVSGSTKAREAEAEGADYLAASPVFSTSSKKDAHGFCGLEGIRRIRAASRLPLIAIGGIGPANAREVVAAGADGIAVISAVIGKQDITAAAKVLRQIVVEAKRCRPDPGKSG